MDDSPPKASPQNAPEKKPFDPATLSQTVIAAPLLQQLRAARGRPTKGKRAAKAVAAVPAPPQLIGVVIDLNLDYQGTAPGSAGVAPAYEGGRAGAKKWVVDALNELVAPSPNEESKQAALNADQLPKNRYSQQYLFVKLEASVIEDLVKKDQQSNDATKAIYRIWPDFQIKGLLNKSISTVKGDAAHASYAALGNDIVWAVLDSGIDGSHQHFKTHDTLNVTPPLQHTDFTGPGATALQDEYGHGTHVAGIIAGAWPVSTPPSMVAYNRLNKGNGEIEYLPAKMDAISGIAPRCTLLSLKVMDAQGQGEVSNLMAAIALIQEMNGYGRKLLVHGVNMSVGYEFDPEWFACGQSPLCVEINRLVRSGVVVVVAAGNTGYGAEASQFNGTVNAGLSLSINDPGNADLAITVGSTHREMPHVYGVSYFSSKGPTGDGRAKPDLVAPGEKILSCAAGQNLQKMKAKNLTCDYLEDSGTSMAAPHVSGAVAAFLSIRREYLGEPEKVKALFMDAATDLKRERYFQGTGLVDLMRAIQSV